MPRFNHMELTLPPGELSAHRAEIREFFAESLQSPGYDHLGFLYETRQEVDLLLEKVKKRQQQDARVQIKEYEDLVAGPVTVHAFYVKFLLPIWFDVQSLEYAAGAEPKKGWRYA